MALDCETAEENVLYWTSVPLAKLEDVVSAQKCRQECENHFFCRAWTWGKDPDIDTLNKVCLLKGLEEDEVLHPLSKQGVVSGKPCRNSWGPPTSTSTTTQTEPPPGEAPFELETPLSYDIKVCGGASDGLDLTSSVDLGEFDHAGSWEYCLSICESTPDCRGWTWGKVRGSGKTDMCWLKGLAEGEEFEKVNDPDLISGDSCHALSRNAGKGEAITLFCWALMLPNTYEQDLLGQQLEDGLNIFACDKSIVYSNVSVEIGGETKSRAVNVNLTCDFGGEFGTALNTDIFIAVWRKLIVDADYFKYDWTVKTDPDTVFFAARLRAILIDHPEEDKGAYLNNCWRGLHGPIEVLSKNAVTTWGDGIDKCTDVLNQLCSGPCQWGEDMWMDQCLWKILHVRRDEVFELLIEDHCDPPEDDSWRTCNDASMVSYHPFKDANEYRDCYHNSQAAAGEFSS
jgi:hypothetical protein